MRRFNVGDSVRVRLSYPTRHVRTPTFIRGKSGLIASVSGKFPNPEERAYGQAGLPAQTLYRVLFRQNEIWPGYCGPEQDTTVVDIFEHWLEEPE
ncbi:MAG: nitrile hydratase subunit beta [Gammaproteobacteria bacterium]|nr:nitrile hydratase subunit beta [Gammaproteobacteria bacterium]